MHSNEPELLVRKDGIVHPEFTTERLAVETARAVDLIDEAVGGVSTTDTPEGVKIRTQGGTLLAIVTAAEGRADLHYRTAPASAPATLKARRLWKALRPYAE